MESEHSSDVSSDMTSDMTSDLTDVTSDITDISSAPPSPRVLKNIEKGSKRSLREGCYNLYSFPVFFPSSSGFFLSLR